MTQYALALTDERWLNMSMTMSGGALSQMTTNNAGDFMGGLLQYCYPYVYPVNYPFYVTGPSPRPIKLTLSEIDTLRALAKENEAARTILAKFTTQIEIMVDF